MAGVRKNIDINGKKLSEDVRKTEGPLWRVYAAADICDQTFRVNVRTNRMHPRTLKRICDYCGLNDEDYIIKAEKPTVTEDTPAPTEEPKVSSNTDALLERIAVALEKIASCEHCGQPTLTDLERCSLLLTQMTSYGSCRESDFEAKAESYNMNTELRAAAYKQRGIKRVNRGAEVWLQRGGK